MNAHPGLVLAINPMAALACLRAIGPEPWPVVAGGQLRNFTHNQRDAMIAWMTKRAGIFAVIPTAGGLVRHVTIRVPRTVRPSALRPMPSLIVTAEVHWLTWSLNEAIPVADAQRLAVGLARQCGGVAAVGEAIPLPGTIRDTTVGIGLLERRAVTMMPPLARAYAVLGGELASVAPAVERGFERGDSITPEAIDWTWPNVIPSGNFTIIMGEPGVGKSGIAMDIAARISSGGPWPDGGRAERGGVIVLESEDDAKSVTVPRLIVAGAVMSNIMVSSDLIDLTTQLPMLDREAKRLGNVRALVLSPLRMYFGGESGRQVDTRQRLEPLLNWAAANRVAVIGVGHKDAGKAGTSAEDVAGPKGFAQRARGVFSAVIDANDPEPRLKSKRRLLINAKANNSPDDAQLAYRIEGARTREGIETSRVHWL